MELSAFVLIIIIVALVASLVSGILVYKNFGRIAIRVRNMKKNKLSDAIQVQPKSNSKSLSELPPLKATQSFNDLSDERNAVGADFI